MWLWRLTAWLGSVPSRQSWSAFCRGLNSHRVQCAHAWGQYHEEGPIIDCSQVSSSVLVF